MDNDNNLELRHRYKLITFHTLDKYNELGIEIDDNMTDIFWIRKDQIQTLIDFLQGQLTTNDKNKL